jgi:hypothetical protein
MVGWFGAFVIIGMNVLIFCGPALIVLAGCLATLRVGGISILWLIPLGGFMALVTLGIEKILLNQAF